MRRLALLAALVVALASPAAAQAAGVFTASSETVPATGASQIVAGDFDGDGKDDVAIAGGASIVIRFNASDPGDALPSTTDGPVLDAGATVTDLAADDLNQDGRDDLAAARGAGNEIRVFLSTPTSGYQATDTTGFAGATEVGIGNGTVDTAPDLYAVTASSMLYATSTTAAGAPTWTNAVPGSFAVTAPTALVVGNFDPTDAADAFAIDNAGLVHAVFRPAGGAGATVHQTLGFAGIGPTAVTAFQFNASPESEVFWGFANGDLALLNRSGSSFVVTPIAGVFADPIRAMTAGDFDDDAGFSELIFITGGATPKAIAWQDATQTSATTTNLPAGSVGAPSTAVPADINEDGALDIALAGGGSVIASLTSRGRAQPSPTSLAFGSQTKGLASAPQRVTLTNDGWAPLLLLGAQVSTSAEGADFFVAADDCTGLLLPFGVGSCDIDVRFNPQAAGARAGTLSFVAPLNVTQPTVALSGTGADPTQGPQGPPGNQGPTGGNGAQGPAGTDGAAGGPGANGSPGADGVTGAPGATGATGPPGKTVLADCDTIDSADRVVCKLSVTAGRTTTVTVRLTRGGKLYATTTVRGLRRGQKLKLPSLRRVPRGNYRLEVVTRAKGQRNASKVSYRVAVR